MDQAPQVKQDKAAGGGPLPGLIVATEESNPLVSLRVTLSPTHTSTPCQKEGQINQNGASFHPRLADV